MGATLRYAKVIDRERLQEVGGQLKPHTASVVRLPGDGPATAEPFLVMRAWDLVPGAFDETWRILDPHGRTVHDSVTRTVVAGASELVDEIAEQQFEYADDGYQLVFEVDGREVARTGFPVVSG